MPLLPPHIMDLLSPFAPVFSRRVWPRVAVLVIGAILAPGARMVSSVLRVMGLAQLPSFQNYHRVLNRARWSSLATSRVLLGLLILTLVPTGPLVVGIDETIERRRGRRIRAAGRYRDPVRSGPSGVVKVRGLRWISMMLLVPIPWAHRVWALPFLTVLAPSSRADEAAHRRHKTIAVWARQMIRLLHRWYPRRSLVIIGDGEYATIELLKAVDPIATVITRLRLDAQLYLPPLPRPPGQRGRTRRIGPRLPSLAARLDDPTTPWHSVLLPHWYGERNRPIELVAGTAIWYTKNGQGRLVPIRWVLIRDPRMQFPSQALLCTDRTVDPMQVVSWFILRWSLEVTFHEVRAHLGVETQRQWSDGAIARTTPALFGLFSVVTLLAHDPMTQEGVPLRQAAWYQKPQPTFIDALALVRRTLWTQLHFPPSLADHDRREISQTTLEHLCDMLAYAA